MTHLPEVDKPSYFGLPENIERSAQRIISSQVISQLKILQRGDAKASKFDKEVWANELGPVLNLWKKLNSVCTLLHSNTSWNSIKKGICFSWMHLSLCNLYFLDSGTGNELVVHFVSLYFSDTLEIYIKKQRDWSKWVPISDDYYTQKKQSVSKIPSQGFLFDFWLRYTIWSKLFFCYTGL